MANPFESMFADPEAYGPTIFSQPAAIPETSIAPTPAAVAPVAGPPTSMDLTPNIGGGTFDITGNLSATGQPPAPPAPPLIGGLDINRAADVISRLESGGNYQATTNAGRGRVALGKYQVLNTDLGDWLSQAGMPRMTPQEFLNSPQAQEQLFRHRFGQYAARYGNRAASAWFAGEGGMNNPNASDVLGTSVARYQASFDSLYGSHGQFTPDNQGSLPTSSRASAMVPGLGGAGGPPQLAPAPGLPSNVARPGWLGILDQLGLATPGAVGTRPMPQGGFTPYGAWFDQMPVAQQQAANAIIQRGQQLRLENPGATPDQLVKLLLRDKVFGQNGLYVGSNVGAVLNAAVTPIVPPQVIQAPPNTSIFTNTGGQIAPIGITPAPEVNLIQGLGQVGGVPGPNGATPGETRLQQYRTNTAAQTPEQQGLDFLVRSGVIDESTRQFALANGYTTQPIVNQYGQVTGYQLVNKFTGQPLALGSRQVGTNPANPPGNIGSPAAPVAPAAGTPGATGVTPPASAAPGAFNAQPRVVARRGDHQIQDVPDLSLQTSLLSNPATMALGAGPVNMFLGAWGRVVGNIPGMAATEEESLNRETALTQFRAAYSDFRGGSRTAGQHREQMAEVPTAGEIFTNPLRSVNRFISVREGLVREMQLYQQQSTDSNLDVSTRRTASDNVAKIQGLLLRLPSIESMVSLADDLRRGANIAGINLSDVTQKVGEAVGVAERAVGLSSQPTSLPQDLSGYSLEELQKLARRPGRSVEDNQRLINAIRVQSGMRPQPPMSR